MRGGRKKARGAFREAEGNTKQGQGGRERSEGRRGAGSHGKKKLRRGISPVGQIVSVSVETPRGMYTALRFGSVATVAETLSLVLLACVSKTSYTDSTGHAF